MALNKTCAVCLSAIGREIRATGVVSKRNHFTYTSDVNISSKGKLNQSVICR